MFVSHGTREKGYRVHDLKSNKIIVLRSLVFDYSAKFNWETKEIVYIYVPWTIKDEAVSIIEFENGLELPQQSTHTSCVMPNTYECVQVLRI